MLLEGSQLKIFSSFLRMTRSRSERVPTASRHLERSYGESLDPRQKPFSIAFLMMVLEAVLVARKHRSKKSKKKKMKRQKKARQKRRARYK